MLRTSVSLAWVLVAFGLGCSEDASTGSGSGGTGGATTSASTGGSIVGEFVAGGDRPVVVNVPTTYEKGEPAPLVILLHGYSVNGAIQELLFNLLPVTEERGIVYAHPDGTKDPQGNPFWNATDACCNFAASNVDDSKYLIDLVDEIKSKVDIDPKRVFFVGHSNGGFMSYRMACDHSDAIAAIVSLAGATFDDPADCAPTNPVSILQIHGTQDETIAYEGGMLVGKTFPSALETVDAWRAYDGCDDVPAAAIAPDLDLDGKLAGSETKITRFSEGCGSSSVVELWTIEGGKHVPDIGSTFAPLIVDFLMSHPKP